MHKDDPDSFAALFEAGPRVPKVRRYREGEVLDLEVVRVTPEAVFLAMDGKQEGIVDGQALTGSDGQPSVTVGSRLAVRVTEVDRSTGEIHLTPVSSEPLDPTVGPEAETRQAAPGAPVVVGMRIKGNVTGVERYGVFVEIAGASDGKRPLRGLVPTRELGAPRGADLRKLYPVGTEVEALVVHIDEKKRIRLSVVALEAAEERRDYAQFAAEKGKGATEERGRGASGFGTFADLIKHKSR